MPLNAAGKPDCRKLPASGIRLYFLCHCKPRSTADKGKQPARGQEQNQEALGSASGPSLSAMFSALNIRTAPAGSPGAASNAPLPLPSCPPSSAAPPEICKANFFIEVPTLPQQASWPHLPPTSLPKLLAHAQPHSLPCSQHLPNSALSPDIHSSYPLSHPPSPLSSPLLSHPLPFLLLNERSSCGLNRSLFLTFSRF